MEVEEDDVLSEAKKPRLLIRFYRTTDAKEKVALFKTRHFEFDWCDTPRAARFGCKKVYFPFEHEDGERALCIIEEEVEIQRLNKEDPIRR